VDLSLFTGSRQTPRRTTALIGSFAVLFQALVFAWHHHDLPFAVRDSHVASVAANSSGTPASNDRDCPICFALAHHGAVPVDLFAVARPEGQVLQQIPPVTIGAPVAPYLLFRSRAPPRA
jgi:hypothetical protein